MQFSAGIYEAMGYKLISPGEEPYGAFSRCDVYTITGVVFDADCLYMMEDEANGVCYKIGFGNNVNAICNRLLSDDFVDDEEKWKKEFGFHPPFMLLTIGPLSEYKFSGDYAQFEAEVIYSYDGFRDAKEELARNFESLEPSLLTALALSFSTDDRMVRFVHRSTAVSGRSRDGRTIHDICLVPNATASVSTKMLDRELAQMALSSASLARSLDPQVSKFYHLGTSDADPLRKFLFLFLFIERSISLTYASISHKDGINDLLSSHRRLVNSGIKLLDSHRDSWKDLRNKLIWCAMNKWSHLDDSDVEQFEKMKKVRDDIAHGKQSFPEYSTIQAIERLAHRISGIQRSE